MKHLIFTRFYSERDLLTDEELLSDKYLVPGLRHLQRFLIPSLINQTSKNFTLAILVHDKLKAERPDIYDELNNITTPFETMVVETSNKESFADSLNEDFIIGSRIDIDDCIFNDAVRTVQSLLDPKLDFMFYAFMKGATMFENKMYDLYEMEASTYDGWSSFSIFPTMISNWKKQKALPFYNHCKLLTFASNNNIELVKNKNHFYNYDVPCAWIYLQHDLNGNLLQGIKNGHRSNTRLNYSPEQIKGLFGI